MTAVPACSLSAPRARPTGRITGRLSGTGSIPVFRDFAPSPFLRGAKPLCAPCVGAQLPHPLSGGRSAPPPRVTFSPMRKSPKESPRGGRPLWVLPLGGIFIPPAAASAAPPRKGCHHVQLKYLRGCRNPYTPTTNTARVESGGIQGGPPPCAGGPGTRRFLAYLCLLSLREKVGRGAGRSARPRGLWGQSPPRSSRVPTHPR